MYNYVSLTKQMMLVLTWPFQGMPRIGNGPFAAYFNTKIFNSQRMVHTADIVPQVSCEVEFYDDTSYFRSLYSLRCR